MDSELTLILVPKIFAFNAQVTEGKDQFNEIRQAAERAAGIASGSSDRSEDEHRV